MLKKERTNLIARIFGRKRLYAIYYHNNQDKTDAIHKLSKLIDSDLLSRDGRIFSSWGTSIEPAETFDNNMHYLAPLNSQFKRAYVFYRAIPLPVGIPLYSVLGMILLHMGKDSELYIQLPKSKSPSHQWIDMKGLQENLPSVRVNELSDQGKGWICVRPKRGLKKEVAAFNSIYPRLASTFSEFRKVIDKENNTEKEDLSKSEIANQSFIYSMHWALATSSIMRLIFNRFGKSGPLMGIDIGGDHGFLACELATMGHVITNLELNCFRIEHMMPWLSQACRVSGRVDGRVGRMEDLIPNHENREKFDLVSLMGSLLLCDREKVSDVLEATKTLLKQGGLIILRENLHQGESDLSSDKFKAEELHMYLEQIGGKLIYFDHYGVEIDYTKVQNSWLVYAAIQKIG